MSKNEALGTHLLRRLTNESRDALFAVVEASSSDRRAYEGRIAELEREHSAAIARREGMLRALERRVRESDNALASQRRANRKLRRAIDEVHSSTSWKVTRPIRALSHLMKDRGTDSASAG